MADGTITSGCPDSKWGDYDYLKVGSQDYLGEQKALIKFRVVGIPSDAVVTKPEALGRYDADDRWTHINVTALVQGWVEGTIPNYDAARMQKAVPIINGFGRVNRKRRPELIVEAAPGWMSE